MSKAPPPNTLTLYSRLVLLCASRVRRLELAISDTLSFALGSYWRSHSPLKIVDNEIREGARTYLINALGGNAEFVDQALATAYSQGGAVLIVAEKRVVPLIEEDRLALERGIARRQFKSKEAETPPPGLIYIDTPEDRVPTAEVKQARLSR